MQGKTIPSGKVVPGGNNNNNNNKPLKIYVIDVDNKMKIKRS